MKTSVLLILFWSMNLPCFGQECVRPRVAIEFGKPVVVTAEFVARTNTYYAQNVVGEPFTLRVIFVNGQKLSEAVLIEYKLEADKKTTKELEQTDVVREFEAYETVYQPSSATPWLEGAQGTGFYLNHLLHIRPATKKE